MIETIKIPNSRIAVLIGKNGSVKRKIEKELGVKLSINEEVSIKGDALNVMDAGNIVKAIGRGFAPEKALELLNENITFSIIELSKDDKKLKRLKSRIIGEDGRARKNLENLTDTYISVFGKTVGVIGTYEDVKDLSEAIEMFIKGFSHRAIYAFLEKQRVKRKALL